MTLTQIRKNNDTLKDKNKDELIVYVQELLLKEKKYNNKIICLNSEIRYLNRQLNKIKSLIEKILQNKPNNAYDYKGDNNEPRN